LQPPQHIGEAESSAARNGAESPSGSTSWLVKQAVALTSIPSALCYLILYDGQEAVVIAKGYIQALSNREESLLLNES
jgi:hypothetical protein